MKNISFYLFILVTTLVSAQVDTSFFDKADAFFKKNVKNGKVDYAGIKNSPSEIETLVAQIADATPAKNDAKNYQAFYINAYNILVIHGIVQKYPVKSPMDIGGFFDGKKHTVAGKKITLNGIENKMLRAQFPDEARFHFALVCAGLGCPPIIDEAYKPSTLDKQLQQQTELSLNNPDFIRQKGNKVLLSQIFEWYKEDFTRNGNEIAFINKFRKDNLPTDAKTGYYTYDWTLNDQK